MSRIAVWL